MGQWVFEILRNYSRFFYVWYLVGYGEWQTGGHWMWCSVSGMNEWLVLAAEVENIKGEESLREKVVSSSVHTVTLRFLWDIQVELSIWWRGLGGGWADIVSWNLSIERMISAMWENKMSRKGIERMERFWRRKENLGSEEKGQLWKERQRNRSPQDRLNRSHQKSRTKERKLHGSHSRKSRSQQFQKPLNTHIWKEMKPSIDFENKDIHDFRESSFQAAEYISQLPWVKEWMGGKQRHFSWSALPSTAPSKGGCLVHDSMALNSCIL